MNRIALLIAVLTLTATAAFAAEGSFEKTLAVSGDYVLVERTATAREGEIIVALVDGYDATLKRFYREGGMIRLQPSNKEMAPIFAPASNVAIQGKVLGILRKYA